MRLRRHLRLIPGKSAMENFTTQRETENLSPILRVAFASNDRQQVNQHFGSAEGFVIYEISPQQANLVEVLEFESQVQDGQEDKLINKLQALTGCAIVYCQAVGASAIRQLATKGIQPIKVGPSQFISQLIKELQRELEKGEMKWGLKIPAKSVQDNETRFDKMETEGWNE